MAKNKNMTTDELKIKDIQDEKLKAPLWVTVSSRIFVSIVFLALIPVLFVLTFTFVIEIIVVFIALNIAFPFAVMISKSKYGKFVLGPVRKINSRIEMFNFSICKSVDILYHKMIGEEFNLETFKKNYDK